MNDIVCYLFKKKIEFDSLYKGEKIELDISCESSPHEILFFKIYTLRICSSLVW